MQDHGEIVHLAVTRDITQRKLAEADLRETEILNRAILDSVGVQIAVLDSKGVIIAVNEPWERFALENSPVPGKPASGTGTGVNYLAICQGRTGNVTDGLMATREGIQAVLERRQSSFAIEYPCHSPTQQRWFNMTVTPLGAVGRGAVVAHTDITHRKLAEADLRIAATAFDAQEGIVVTDVEGKVLRINKAFTETTGYTPEDIVGQTPRLLRSGRHDAEFYREMWETINSTGSWQGEIWDRRKNGEVYPKWLTISAVKGADGGVTHYVGTHFDITERKKAEEKIEELAFFDQLTGLPNRTLLMDRLKQAMTAGNRNKTFGSVLFIDLDHFKTLNDTLGHDKGDQLLEQVAKRLDASVREGDTVARLGGDEFVVVLGGLNGNAEDAASQTEVVGEKILLALSQPYQLGGIEHLTTGSIGATLFSGHETSIDDLLKQADLAMYKAKDTGRNTLSFFDPAMQTIVMERVALEEHLRQALGASQFLLHYQAQVVGHHRVTGAEVLVRWKHPERGMVSPAEFIPLAEETGLILPLGHWVLETACRQLAKWAAQPEMANLTVAVNVSAHQFRQADFVDQVLAVLKDTGADPRRLKLELTESMLVSNVEDIVEKMFALKAKGVAFSLDDFGTGFSSLSYLKRLPLDQLKIDQSFVREVLSDPNDAAIAKTVIALAQSLGLGVIAEGVETEAQRDFLAGSGCHAYQGYFFSRPLPVEGFEAFARRV
jgi:diguanylate cyclase (GGDEF)-like protein/PAS domain S-box-containing protein